jgi:hypothetical protein
LRKLSPLRLNAQLSVVELSANAGVITVPLIQLNIFTSRLRVVFDFDPQENRQSELCLQLMRDAKEHLKFGYSAGTTSNRIGFCRLMALSRPPIQ